MASGTIVQFLGVLLLGIMICDAHSEDPYMSLTRMRRSLDWAPITEDFDYEK